MMNERQVIAMSDLPARLRALIETVNHRDDPCFVVDGHEVRAVLLGATAYDALIERLEDLEDSLTILEARESGEPTRSLDEYLHEQGATQDIGVSR
jgi:PHD/YefM family antitoxin component YafN of YafNO toxin-antitoxin module